MFANCTECGLELEEEKLDSRRVNRFSFFKEKDIQERNWSIIECICETCFGNKLKGTIINHWVEVKPPKNRW